MCSPLPRAAERARGRAGNATARALDAARKGIRAARLLDELRGLLLGDQALDDDVVAGAAVEDVESRRRRSARRRRRRRAGCRCRRRRSRMSSPSPPFAGELDAPAASPRPRSRRRRRAVDDEPVVRGLEAGDVDLRRARPKHRDAAGVAEHEDHVVAVGGVDDDRVGRAVAAAAG